MNEGRYRPTEMQMLKKPAGAAMSSARQIVRAVRRGGSNPFPPGTPGGVSFAFAEELQRVASHSGNPRLASMAKEALDSHDPTMPKPVEADSDASLQTSNASSTQHDPIGMLRPDEPAY